jgi:hypothetical protein
MILGGPAEIQTEVLRLQVRNKLPLEPTFSVDDRGIMNWKDVERNGRSRTEGSTRYLPGGTEKTTRTSK